MARKLKAPVGPSRLSKILTQLKSSPKLSLFGIRSLRLSYAYRNDHWGARHFAKEQLPKLRYANPALKIEVEKVLKRPEEQWRPEIELQLEDGSRKTIDMHNKWSTSIVKELMELAGGDPWRRWKATASKNGQPLVPGEEYERPTPPSPSGMLPLPNLKVYRETHPPQEKKKGENTDKKVALDAAAKAKGKKGKKDEVPTLEVDLSNSKTKTGAAATNMPMHPTTAFFRESEQAWDAKRRVTVSLNLREECWVHQRVQRRLNSARCTLTEDYEEQFMAGDEQQSSHDS
ncbi:hypothetical protein V5O48_005089 [Marasmius crinis-equi]|uniref:Ribosomal protein/NADH dehydrogenase domain-containing protein n=1 Tax=Marasmius crinis-equi TaxID=585013 RepID=A0ABR3FNN7_9AGAR